MTVYRWKNGSRVKASAQAAGEACEALERAGNLTPAALVDASRPEDAPLHGCFEWNDAKAAERYRESQAAYIIRSVEVEIVGSCEPTRAFVSVEVVGEESEYRRVEEREYRRVEAVLSDPSSRGELLRMARRDMEAFRRKYADLEELAAVFAAMDEAAA